MTHTNEPPGFPGWFKGDFLVRWGGEEFLVVAKNMETADAPSLAERVVGFDFVGGEPYEISNRIRVRRSCSVGYAPLPLQLRWPDRVGWEEVIDLADQALYAAKGSGRNCWVGVEDGEGGALPQHLNRQMAALIDAGKLRLRASVSLVVVREALAKAGS